VTDPSRASRIFMGRMEGKPPHEQQQEQQQQKQPGQPAGGFDLN
jgi:pilus assembly protein CpaC